MGRPDQDAKTPVFFRRRSPPKRSVPVQRHPSHHQDIEAEEEHGDVRVPPESHAGRPLRHRLREPVLPPRDQDQPQPEVGERHQTAAADKRRQTVAIAHPQCQVQSTHSFKIEF